jgi:predicted NBD/HSP70 family sugar kinase
MPQTTPWLRDSPGAVLSIFREHRGGLTKSEAMQLTGLSRTAISQRVDLLAAHGLLKSITNSALEGRGRPAERFELAKDRGVMVVADTGATGMRTAVFNPAGTMLAERYEAFDISSGPTAILSLIDGRFRELLAGLHLSIEDVLGIGIDLPGPVDHTTRRVISPPIMTGWHNFDIPNFFADYHCVVVVEKDTNAMAFGEHQRQHPEIDDLMFIKLGTGLGTGLIIRGELYRGADGAAGDIGHVPLAVDSAVKPPLCRCGNYGCLEAYAGGWALARDLTSAGYPSASVNDVVSAAKLGNQVAIDLVRRAAVTIGAAISDTVNLINPRIVVFGGQLAELDDIILAAVREVIYGRSLPLATRNLQIVSTSIADPGVYGLAHLVTDEVYSVKFVDAQLIQQAHAVQTL